MTLNQTQIVLPPKRFQKPEDPWFDPIRHKAWFRKLYRRRTQIPALEMALAEITACNSIKEKNDPMHVIATRWDVDERELRDFISFRGGLSYLGKLPEDDQIIFKAVLDQAYDAYCKGGAEDTIRHYIQTVGRYFPGNTRQMIEAWEVDPTFYPRGYQCQTS